MSDTVRCPDCGHENPPGVEGCAKCGFPLGAPEIPPATSAGPLESPPIVLPPRRPRRPPRGSPQSTALWLIFGTIAALVMVWVAIKANVERASQPVEGASPAQQASADSILAQVERDSTNVKARVKLGDVLFDTSNWGNAIVQYRAALRMDSSLTSTLVDLGVCYYNLGDAVTAQRHFMLALARDPHHPVALFNLGIVHESRREYREALQYYHRALEAEPREEIKRSIVEAMARIQKETESRTLNP